MWTFIFLSTIYSSDPLEEVVGLDIGYVGVNHRSPNIGDGADESEDRMQEYLREYEHRQRERAFFKKMNQARRNSPGGIPASSV